jgi:hypothetical protein
MSRPIVIDLRTLLSLVLCAEEFDFNHVLLLLTLGQMTGPVSDEEIAEYAAETADHVALPLTVWRDHYAGKPGL